MARSILSWYVVHVYGKEVLLNVLIRFCVVLHGVEGENTTCIGVYAWRAAIKIIIQPTLSYFVSVTTYLPASISAQADRSFPPRRTTEGVGVFRTPTRWGTLCICDIYEIIIGKSIWFPQQ